MVRAKCWYDSRTICSRRAGRKFLAECRLEIAQGHSSSRAIESRRETAGKSCELVAGFPREQRHHLQRSHQREPLEPVTHALPQSFHARSLSNLLDRRECEAQSRRNEARGCPLERRARFRGHAGDRSRGRLRAARAFVRLRTASSHRDRFSPAGRRIAWRAGASRGANRSARFRWLRAHG